MKMVLVEYKAKGKKAKKEIKKIEKFYGKSIVDLLNERMAKSNIKHLESEYVKNVIRKVINEQ